MLYTKYRQQTALRHFQINRCQSQERNRFAIHVAISEDLYFEDGVSTFIKY